MKNNGNKINILNANPQQIKVNLNQKNSNINVIQAPLYQEYPEYYNLDQNKIIMDELKNVKYQDYLDPNTYNDDNIFTEYESLPKYSINPLNIYKLGNIPSKDFECIYNNTNGDINKDNELIINNQNKHNLYRSIYNNENYTSRAQGKQRKITSLKGNKKTNIYQNTSNSYNNMKDNSSKSLINQKNSFQRGTKLNISKSLIEYPLNFSKNIIRNKSKYKSYNNTVSQEDNEEENEDELIIKIPKRQITKSRKKDIGKYYISTPNTSNSNKKETRQNKPNFGFNRRKNNDIISPDNIDINHISNIKTSNFNTYTKHENDTINSYNSCYNFYQKGGDINPQKKNEININMHNTMNNFGYINTNNSVQELNQINPFYSRMNNEDIYMNENGSKYINIIDPDFKNNNKKINIIDDNYDDDDNNFTKINIQRHMKGQKSLEIPNSLSTREMQFNNILDISKFIKYKKKLLEEFCHCLEEFIFINVKNNFDSFINKLRKISKEKPHNFLLLKRLQNKGIKKNIYKERACSYKYNTSNPFYASININNINNNNANIHRKNNYITNDPSKDFLGRNSVYDFEKNNYIYNNREMKKVQQNYRIGKSQERTDANEANNRYYLNDNYYNNNKKDIHNYGKNVNKVKDRQMTSIEKYGNNVYIPKKFKKISNYNTTNKLNIKKKSRLNNLNDYFNMMNSHKKSRILNTENDMNKSHDLDDEIIRAKIKKNYNINYIKNNNSNNIQDMSYDANNNNHLSINKEFENGLLNQINDNSKENTNIISIKDINDSKNKPNVKPIYKKKIKITQAKSKIFGNKRIANDNNNKMINNKNRKAEKVLSPNMRQIQNNNFEKIEKINITSLSNKKENIENRCINQINLENNNKEIMINKDNKTNNINNNKQTTYIENNNQNNNEINSNDNENNNNKSVLSKDNPEKINDNGNNNIQIKKNNEEGNNVEVNNNNENNEMINTNNNDLIGSNGNNIINDDTEESDENVTKEIIVKDVSTRDKRLNVFIKYIEINGLNKVKNKINNSHLFNVFHTHSIYLPTLFPKKNNSYYSNYLYGNQNNKIKLHKILSSIIEEEEKSKAAGSVNNSIISEEENYKNGNFSHFYLQSVKYVTTFLQSIFNDKKKDMFFKFFKILKRIKNDAFLKGLINQKKYQSLKNLKEDNDEENENNTSGDVILYNVNDNFSADINYFGSKSNDRKDINNIRNKNNYNNISHEEYQNEININKIKEALDLGDDMPGIDKKHASSNNLINILNDEHLYINTTKLNLSMDNNDINKTKNSQTIKDSEERVINKNDKIKKLKEIIGHVEEYENLRIVQKYFKEWEKMGNEENEINDDNKNNKDDEDNNNEVDYAKNVTISEACRSLSDVILDFKIYLVKYCLKNKNKMEYE